MSSFNKFCLICAFPQDNTTPIRGFRKDTNQCLLGHLYSIIRTGRQPRRSLLQSMLRIFDDHKVGQVPVFFFLNFKSRYFTLLPSMLHTSNAALSRGTPQNIPRVTYIFSVYTREIQVTSRILHDIPRERLA